MPANPNKLAQFWQELKRRKVVRVITIYAAIAFVILQLVEILAPSLRLPEWTMNFILVLLIVGFIITVIVSWIYDIHPEGGIVKTEPARKVKTDEIPVSTNSWRVATYASGIIIIGLLALNIFGRRKTVEIDESLAKSIAVLPFHNYSGDPDQDPMCLGLTDEIISHLYKVKSFDEVRPLTTVLNYKDSDQSTAEIAEDLRVNYILEGTYKRIGEELRVTAQLIDPKNDKHIWLQDYDRPWEEIITIPADIALQIADHLKVLLTVSETENIKQIPTINLKAYELMGKTSYIFNNQGFSALSQIISLANKAIELDPDYADAYAWLGNFTLFKGAYAGGSEMQSVAWDALPFFEKALALDQNNAPVHTGMGQINEYVKWDYINAEKKYIKAIELEPNNLNILTPPIEFFIKRGQLENALKYIEKCQESDVFNLFNNMTHIHILSGNKKEAYHSISLESSVVQSHRWVGENYIWLEEYDSSKFYLESAIKSEHPEMLLPRFQAYLALVYKKTKNHLKARTIVNQLIAKSDTTAAGSPAYFTGWYYSRIGEEDSAFYWLEKAYNNRSPELPWLKVDPAFNNLKDDDRYWDLYERTGHKTYDEYMASKTQ